MADGEGAVVIRRLHRLVRAGFVPMLGHPAMSGQDGTVEMHRRGQLLCLLADGTLRRGDGGLVAGADAAGFDALFPPDRPNKRNLVRRLYEMGLGS